MTAGTTGAATNLLPWMMGVLLAMVVRAAARVWLGRRGGGAPVAVELGVGPVRRRRVLGGGRPVELRLRALPLPLVRAPFAISADEASSVRRTMASSLVGAVAVYLTAALIVVGAQGLGTAHDLDNVAVVEPGDRLATADTWREDPRAPGGWRALTAEAAGLRSGDRILAVGAFPTDDGASVLRALSWEEPSPDAASHETALLVARSGADEGAPGETLRLRVRVVPIADGGWALSPRRLLGRLWVAAGESPIVRRLDGAALVAPVRLAFVQGRMSWGRAWAAGLTFPTAPASLVRWGKENLWARLGFSPRRAPFRYLAPLAPRPFWLALADGLGVSALGLLLPWPGTDGALFVLALPLALLRKRRRRDGAAATQRTSSVASLLLAPSFGALTAVAVSVAFIPALLVVGGLAEALHAPRHRELRPCEASSPWRGSPWGERVCARPREAISGEAVACGAGSCAAADVCVDDRLGLCRDKPPPSEP